MSGAVAVRMPEGFTIPPAVGPAVSGNQAPAGVTGVPPAGPAAPLPGYSQQQPQPHNFLGYGQPIQMADQQPGYARQPSTQQPAPNDAAFQAAVLEQARLMVQQGQVPGVQTQPVPADLNPLHLQKPQQPADAPAWLPQDLNTFDVNTIQDPVIRSMAGMFKMVGKDMDMNRVVGNALAKQDPSLIDIAYLAEKGGAQAGQLAQLARDLVGAVQMQSERITQSVIQSAGGEAQWSAATAVFNQSAPPGYAAVIGKMLDSGDEAQIKQAAQAIMEFSAGRLPVQHQGVGPLANGLAGGAQALSANDFKAELFKLDQNAPNYEQQCDELYARRAMGKQMGL